jgi:hypothetical protein
VLFIAPKPANAYTKEETTLVRQPIGEMVEVLLWVYVGYAMLSVLSSKEECLREVTMPHGY